MLRSDRETIASELESFLRETFQIPEDDPLFDRTVRLWEEGYVDSAGVVQTIAFLEDRFGLALPDEAIRSSEFSHVDGIAEIVANLLAAGSRC